MTNDEGNVMKISCWLSSKGELETEKMEVMWGKYSSIHTLGY
ncbi:hypothetical protein HMPREF1320_2118 [Capnocytophaga sp. oral taxon 335 str. F0486]|nr:hypothetical protein HMPREF1320_2118 [Capnocytophaga sp. oral taxon 335 str. F0486]